MAEKARRRTPPGNDNLDLEAQLCFALYAATLAVGKAYAPLLAELGLTYPQYLVMLALWQEDGSTVRALGERLHLASGTLTPMLKRMEGAGLIRRTRDARDERQVRIGLTPAGRDLRARATHLPCGISRAMGLPADKLARIRDDLQAIRRSLDAAAGAGSARDGVAQVSTTVGPPPEDDPPA